MDRVDAQSGGPPMITDDPGVCDLHHFEINTSVNTSFTQQGLQLSLPYIDANYGIANHLQLKVEFPYLINFYKNQPISGALGAVIPGLKYEFMDESKHFLSMGIYPQITVTGDEKGFLLPLLMEKTFGKFLIGEDIGIFWGEHSNCTFSNGNLIGYKFSDKFEIMGEYFWQQQIKPTVITNGYMNYGCRYTINPHIVLMLSAGTQAVANPPSERQNFFSYLGVQTDF